jgi:hypothetical protein
MYITSGPGFRSFQALGFCCIECTFQTRILLYRVYLANTNFVVQSVTSKHDFCCTDCTLQTRILLHRMYLPNTIFVVQNVPCKHELLHRVYLPNTNCCTECTFQTRFLLYRVDLANTSSAAQSVPSKHDFCCTECTLQTRILLHRVYLPNTNSVAQSVPSKHDFCCTECTLQTQTVAQSVPSKHDFCCTECTLKTRFLLYRVYLANTNLVGQYKKQNTLQGYWNGKLRNSWKLFISFRLHFILSYRPQSISNSIQYVPLKTRFWRLPHSGISIASVGKQIMCWMDGRARG